MDVGETPFFISVDYNKSAIVITIRGTLSMKDIITDLSAESELIPLQNINHTWKGHKVLFQLRAGDVTDLCVVAGDGPVSRVYLQQAEVRGAAGPGVQLKHRARHRQVLSGLHGALAGGR